MKKLLIVFISIVYVNSYSQTTEFLQAFENLPDSVFIKSLYVEGYSEDVSVQGIGKDESSVLQFIANSELFTPLATDQANNLTYLYNQLQEADTRLKAMAILYYNLQDEDAFGFFVPVLTFRDEIEKVFDEALEDSEFSSRYLHKKDSRVASGVKDAMNHKAFDKLWEIETTVLTEILTEKGILD